MSNLHKYIFICVAVLFFHACDKNSKKNIDDKPIANQIGDDSDTSKNDNPAVKTTHKTFVCTKSKPWECGKLKVDKNNRILQHEDGTAFFWMADTAWFLRKLNENELNSYLDNRVEKKFSVIQITAMYTHQTRILGKHYPFAAEGEENRKPSFNSNEITTINEEYWKVIDNIIKKAEEKGLYIAMLPTWHTILGEETFGEADVRVANVRKFGAWIAKRYKKSPNIIWMIGGDTPIDGSRTEGKVNGDQEIAIWNAMGSSIKNVVRSKHLVTFHPLLKIPSVELGEASKKWLDFNMIQSGRDPLHTAIKDVQDALKEKLPVVDGESIYEGIRYKREENLTDKGRRTPYQIREDAYSQIFAGAFGNTYGHTAIYRFWTETDEDENCTTICKPNTHWEDAIDHNGAKQMQFVTELMQSRPLLGRVSDQSLLQGTPQAKDGIVATKGDGYAMVYIPQGQDITVDMNKVPGTKVKAWWYNPRDGTSRVIEGVENNGMQAFNPPDEVTAENKKYFDIYYDPHYELEKKKFHDGNDWVLVLDDSSRGFLAPGK
ncbi:MAG: glycoside hydrolase family 140 protein [Sulfurovum sp.]|nr:glycoside hydrolase family 140 protein [Sulfurovum sp.]